MAFCALASLAHGRFPREAQTAVTAEGWLQTAGPAGPNSRCVATKPRCEATHSRSGTEQIAVNEVSLKACAARLLRYNTASNPDPRKSRQDL